MPHMIVIANSKGEKRRVPEGVTFRLAPDEAVIGSDVDETYIRLNRKLAEEKMGLGDFVEKAIKLLPKAIRPKHCSACEKRKHVLNHVRELGIAETFKQLSEIKE